MKNKIFFILFLFPLSGCEITAQFYVEKAWDVSPGFTSSNPDMKTRAQVEFKIPLGDKAKKTSLLSK